MQYWERLTRQANRAYSSHAYMESVELNRLALSWLEASIKEDFGQDAESMVAAATVSYLNIAESYTALGDFISANSQYELAVNFLQSALQREGLADEHKALIARTASHIRFEWELFSKSHGKAFTSQSKALMQALTNAVSYSNTALSH
ncbi:tetratricopeptide repeat protein [Marinomonas epiphytica]